ncbi:Putative disease resistance protein RGA3 [Linum perenne]
MVPHSIQELKHLRFLDLSHNKIMTRLPSSITMLQNMQVLILYGCQSLEELPRDIMKLANLWQLSCRFCFALTHMPVGISELTRLETLTWFVVGNGDDSTSKHIGGLDELLELNSLRGIFSLTNLSRLRGGRFRLSPHTMHIELAWQLI